MNPPKLSLLLIQIVLLGIGTSYGQTNIGIFDNQTAIGHCKVPGFASYNNADQTYTIGGSGENMWFDKDAFHYVWTTLQGDFILRAEVKFLGKGVEQHRKAGWIVKNNLDPFTRHINAAVHGDGLTSLQFRATDGGNTEEVISKDSMPTVVQLERRGNQFLMSTARFGDPFITVQADSMKLDKEVYIGLYVCSHNPEVLETVQFRNVRIIKPVDAGFEPYRDYLGSHLEVMDVENGLSKVLYSSAHSIQAPNWTTDGKALLFNSKGRLYEYGLETQQVRPFNTGFATGNNNDHVLSFDGKLLGISHHNPADKGNSTIYYLSSKGDSTPALVTKPGVGASYLHGWSPDNKKMIFTGHRKGQYDIYEVDVTTGKEKQLTNEKTLDDGSEYSPDGKFIYFNSARTGKMKLWKMAPEGKNQTQLTFDEYNDWFPHISPDQRWIVFLSYPKEIEPSDHPFYKHCLIRIMPYEGGKPRVIGYLYGGQGTMNVPGWSPDSKRIAFVTNSKL